MTFDYTFGLDLPMLKKKIISTEQFTKSEELMDLRYELARSEQEMAEIVGKSLQDYLLLEYAMESIPVEEYEETLQKVELYKKKYLRSILKNKLSKSNRRRKRRKLTD